MLRLRAPALLSMPALGIKKKVTVKFILKLNLSNLVEIKVNIVNAF